MPDDLGGLDWDVREAIREMCVAAKKTAVRPPKKCDYCGSQVSSTRSKCGHCGAPRPNLSTRCTTQAACSEHMSILRTGR